jgi:predicted enzyme related to lactoylglutathione lyase
MGVYLDRLQRETLVSQSFRSSACYLYLLGAMFNYSAALVTIAAIDFDRLLAFYSILFQQEPQPYQPNVYGGFKVAGVDLGIFQPKAVNAEEFVQPGGGALSLCLSVSDLELALTHLASAGYPQSASIITASHGRECYVYDPDGNRIILHQGKNLTSSNPSD